MIHEPFNVGDVITPTKTNPWIEGNAPKKNPYPYLTFGKEYEVIKVNKDFVYVIKDSGQEDGFPYPPDGKTKPYFKILPKGEFEEEEISQALEYING